MACVRYPQRMHVEKSLRDRCDLEQDVSSGKHRGERSESGHRATMVNAGTLDASLCGKGVDAFTARSLGGESKEERTIAIESGTLHVAWFPVDVRDTAIACDEWFVLTRLAGWRRNKHGAWEALGTKARGMVGCMGTPMGQQGVSSARRAQGVLSDVLSGGFLDVPRTRGCIADQGVGRDVMEGENGVAREAPTRRRVEAAGTRVRPNRASDRVRHADVLSQRRLAAFARHG